jgi:CCR4-NOT transcription complex subunit 7/8
VNVDCVKVAQISLTFSDAMGHLPPGCSTWIFQFHFDISRDMGSAEAIDRLQKMGVDWAKHASKGIMVNHFGELLTTSGLVLTDDVRWVSFHTGYEYAFLLSKHKILLNIYKKFIKSILKIGILMCKSLPTDESEFFELLHLFFPAVYDTRLLARAAEEQPSIRPGKFVEEVEQGRLYRQGGSDSLKTAAEFFRIRQFFLENSTDDSKFIGLLSPLTI